MLKEKQGFTLIELLIVIIVIGILSAIAIPNYLGAQKKAARAEAKSNLQSLALALEQYYAVNNRYGPTDDNYTFSDVGTWTKSGGGTETNYLESFKPGNQRLYDYQVNISNSGQDFVAKAIPKAGTKVAGDLQPWIDQDNNRGPNGFW